MQKLSARIIHDAAQRMIVVLQFPLLKDRQLQLILRYSFLPVMQNHLHQKGKLRLPALGAVQKLLLIPSISKWPNIRT